MYKVEEIPDIAKLYRRVHQSNFRNGKIVPRAFQESGDGEGMSVDWEKYCTAQQAKGLKNPHLNGVVSFIAGELRKEKLQVLHTPKYQHQSHATVYGVDALYEDVVRRSILWRMFTWEIPTPKYKDQFAP